MTKEKLMICAAVALLGALISFFAETTKRGMVKNALEIAIGVFLLYLIIYPFSSVELDISVEEKNCFDCEKISDSVMKTALAEASKKIEETISFEVSAEFGIENVKSEVKISKDEFKIEKAVIYMVDCGKAVSSYQIKAYLKQKYDMDVEVLTC